jgi:hypothetical protein
VSIFQERSALQSHTKLNSDGTPDYAPGDDTSAADAAVIEIDPSIWSHANPSAFCYPPCTLILPDWTAPNPVTLTPPPLLLTLTEPQVIMVTITTIVLLDPGTTTVTLTSRSTTGTPIIITTTFQPPPVVTTDFTVYPLTFDGTESTSSPSLWIIVPPATIDAEVGGEPHTWIITPPPDPLTGTILPVPEVTMHPGPPGPKCQANCGKPPKNQGTSNDPNLPCMTKCGLDWFCLHRCFEPVDYTECGACGLNIICVAVCSLIEAIEAGVKIPNPEFPDCLDSCFGNTQCEKICKELEKPCKDGVGCPLPKGELPPIDSDGEDNSDDDEEDGEDEGACQISAIVDAGNDPLDSFDNGIDVTFAHPLPTPASIQVTLSGSNLPALPTAPPEKPVPGTNPNPFQPVLGSDVQSCNEPDMQAPSAYWASVIKQGCSAIEGSVVMSNPQPAVSGTTPVYVLFPPPPATAFAGQPNANVYGMIMVVAQNGCGLDLQVSQCGSMLTDIQDLCMASSSGPGGTASSNCKTYYMGMAQMSETLDTDVVYIGTPPALQYANPVS